MEVVKSLLKSVEPYSSYKADELYQILQSGGFFKAPASTKYHGNYEGGLVEHSLNVVDILVELTQKNHIEWQRGASPIIIGLFHDLCKCDAYKMQDGKYVWKDNQILLGHGDKSVMIASSLVQLTIEEVMCIRYHMGAFVDKEEWKSLGLAIKAFPNILWTHQADMLATYCVEGRRC